MILLGCGDIESCKWNAQRMYKKIFTYKENNLQNEKTAVDGGGLMSMRWSKSDTFSFVNISLIYVKCMLI